MTYSYRIRDWDSHFETSQSRKVDRPQWIGIPNKQHGMGLIQILSQADGAAIYGIWQLIVGACSHQHSPRSGWLTQDGTASGSPWTIEDMAQKWRRQIPEVARALDVLCSPKVNWMETIEQLVAHSRHAPSTLPEHDQRLVQSSPVQAGPVPSESPPPDVLLTGNNREENRRKLRAFLARKRFASDNVALEEWIGLLDDEAKCQSLQECLDCLSYFKIEGKRTGVVGRYAPAYEGLAVRWRHERRNKHQDDKGAA